MTTARHRCFSLLMAKDQFTSYMTSHYDTMQLNIIVSGKSRCHNSTFTEFYFTFLLAKNI